MNKLINKLLQQNPTNRPTAQDILDYYVPKMNDFTKTILKRNNSDDKLLQTIKVPRDLNNLKNILPNKKYKDCSDENKNKLPDIDNNKLNISKDNNIVKENKITKNPSAIVNGLINPIINNRPGSRQILKEKQPSNLNLNNINYYQNIPRAKSPDALNRNPSNVE